MSSSIKTFTEVWTSTLLLFILFHFSMTFASELTEENQRFQTIIRPEHSHVRFTCDLTDVAWWKRPNLLATRYGIILSRYRSKMSLEKLDDGTSGSGIQLHVLNIRHLQSNDSGIYECETLGAIRQFHLTVTVRLTSVELGAQLLSPYESSVHSSSSSNHTEKTHLSSSTNHFLVQPLTTSDHGQIRLREHQYLRLTCVVSRALPAVTLTFPFDIDYRVEKNFTSENDDQTYRTVLVLILHIHRSYHRQEFHCEAIQNQLNSNDDLDHVSPSPDPLYSVQHRVLSNTLQMDVLYAPKCVHTYTQTVYTGLRRPINLTCLMHDGNPSKLNFTWQLPTGIIRTGHPLNSTSSSLIILPEQFDHFGSIFCRAQNELDFTGECRINLIMGGIPDPIESCRYTYMNATLTVNCKAGFHQGDEDLFCYMHKKQENGSFSEHARLKGNCAFILPDLSPERYHEFRVFTKNKFGDNYDKSYTIAVGKPRAESLADKTRFYWPYMALIIAGACLVSLLIICCCCHHIRRSMYNKRKGKGNFDSLTYQNHNSHSHQNSHGKQSLVHLKQNGNGTAYPVRPYRSKDYLISSESSTLPRPNAPLRGLYATEEDFVPPRRNNMKETDLDRLIGSSNSTGSSSGTATIKSLPLNRTRPLFAAFGPQPASLLTQDEANHPAPPFSMHRRSSFQTATKVNGFDFYKTQEPFYLVDRQMMKGHQRGTYSPERDLREREQYREKRREYSPYSKDEHGLDLNRDHLLHSGRSRENSFIVENQMIAATTTEHLSHTSSTLDHQWREMNSIDEIDYQDRYLESNERERDDLKEDIDNTRPGDERDPDRLSTGYQRDDDRTFDNYGRDDDRYRDDGIFV